jgi:dihydroxyacetone kinase-like protein
MAEKDARSLVLRLVDEIEKNKAWLSEIDGAIGDGDHGINMAKGFGMVRENIDEQPNELSDLLRYVGVTLVTNIGGAMGPIYGTLFMKMGKALEGRKNFEANDVQQMMSEALAGVKKRGGAEVGDLIQSAKTGMESTKDLVAKKGRSSRLGERSKGVIDAGSASCYIILKTIAEHIKESL